MKRETISLALNNLDDSFISEAAVFRADAGQQGVGMPIPRKRMLTVALAAALILALGIAAYAANLFGIRELYANPNRGEMPEEAAALIVTQNAEVKGSGWTASILESYCDERTVLVSVHLSAEESFLLAPVDESPDSSLWAAGLSGEGKLGDYARQEGKTILFAEAVLDQQALNLTSLGQHFESSSPQEMTILIEGTRSGSSIGTTEAICTVLVQPWSPDANEQAAEVERYYLPVTLAEGGSELIGTYAPADALAIPGWELGELSLTRTPLGISLHLNMTPVERDKSERLLTLRLDGVEFHGSGVIDAENGFAEFSQGQGAPGDSPTLQFLDWDKNTIAAVSFESIKENRN